MTRFISKRLRKTANDRVRALRLETLEDRRLLAVDLVADVNQTGAGGEPTQFAVAGNTAFFAAFDLTRGTELWKTNGTVAGTKFVKDIFPGTDSDYPNSSEPRYLTAVNGTVFFTAFDPQHGRELWKSDGTAAGTVLVKDIWQDDQSSSPNFLVSSGGLLYFSAFDPVNGSQLWKSDGTPGGTTIVSQTGVGSSPTNLTDVNGALYFLGVGPGALHTLYRTTGGTPVAISIPLTGTYHISELENVNGVLYFTTSSTSGNILWRTSGGPAVQVVAAPAGSNNAISFLTFASGTIYGVVGGNRLYSSVGGGPTLAATITPGNIGPLTAVGNRVFFTANDGTNGLQLWVSAGTAATTHLVKVIGSGAGAQTPFNLTDVNGVLYFSVDDGLHGRELWKSDGTEAGTKLVEDLDLGPDSSNPSWITNFNGLALFQATGANGSQVYKSNGTAAGTFAISNLNPLATADAFPDKITDVAGIAYFFADDGVHGRELWKSNGTSAGTTLVADINPGPLGSDRQGLDPKPANVNGTLYFVANDGQNGAELWKTSGGVTSLVKNINPGAGSSNPDNLTAVGSTLYFTANDGANGVTLWKTNGTAAGTISLGPANAMPAELTNVNGTLFFTATEATHGTELWKTNGTPAGTVVVRDIKTGSGSSFPLELTNVNGTLFFSADDGTSGRQLWKSNGLAAGTAIVQTITPGFPHELTNVNGTLYFAASDSAGVNLWKSDGSSVGTQKVLGANPPIEAQYPDQLTNANGTLFFVAGNDPYYDRDLWKSNGTAAGTMLVTNTVFDPMELTAVGATLYFTQSDSLGESLWKSDGTVTGTVELQRFGDGSYNYENDYPRNLTNVGGKLFFSAGDLQHGNELRVVSDGSSALLAAPTGASNQEIHAAAVQSLSDKIDPSAERGGTDSKSSPRPLETLEFGETAALARPQWRSGAARPALSAAAVDSLLTDLQENWR